MTELRFTHETRPMRCPLCGRAQGCKHKCLFQCPDCLKWRELRVSSIILRPSRENAHRLCKSCNRSARNLAPWERERLRETRRKPGEYKHSEESKAKLSKSYTINEARGRSKWFSIVKPNLETIRVQGTFEKWFAEQLIKRGINFKCHEGFIEYFDSKHTLRKYFPDFYLPDTDEYVDIKSKFTMSEKAQFKFEAVRRKGYNIRVIILTRHGMKHDPDSYFPSA